MKRLSIMTFALTAMVATSATLVRADSWYWTGATDNIWSTDANWSKGGNSNVNRMFEEAYFSERFKTDYGYRVQFTGNESISWKAHIRTGTEEQPVVFYADDPSHGLKVNKSDGGWYVGYDGCASGEAWLRLESGTYDTTGYWQIGYTHTGHLIVCEGATVKGTDFYVRKGSVTVEGGTVTVPSGNWARFGSNGASTLNLNGGTFETRHIHKDANSPDINFNGGTLLANAGYANNGGLIQSGIAVNVGSGGGTIDNGGFDIQIGASIGDDGSGVLTFTGSGSTTLETDTLNGLDVKLDDGYLYIAKDTEISKSLTVNGGTFESAVTTWTKMYSGCTLNLNGGCFKTRHIEGYGGTINFNGGTLQATASYVNGLIGGTSVAVTVNGGTLELSNTSSTAITTGLVTVGAKGTITGTATVQNLTLTKGATILCQLKAAGNTCLTVKGNLKHDGDTILVEIPASRQLQVGDEITVFKVSGTHTGTFFLKVDADGTGYEFDTSTLLSNGTLRVTAVVDAINSPIVDAHSGVTYDISGRRISEPTKGIYIKGGKKYRK